MTLPGSAVGAGGALTVGENEGPAGETAFSVGVGAFDGDAGALEAGDDGASVGLSLVAVLQAVRVPIPTMATAPVASANCRVKRAADMIFPCFLFPFIRVFLPQPYVAPCCSRLPYRRRLPAHEARRT